MRKRPFTSAIAILALGIVLLPATDASAGGPVRQVKMQDNCSGVSGMDLNTLREVALDTSTQSWKPPGVSGSEPAARRTGWSSHSVTHGFALAMRESALGLGFLLPTAESPLAGSGSFGTAGLCGTLAWASRERDLAFCYLTTQPVDGKPDARATYVLVIRCAV